jgi:OOP family OmpA-OmpF porin
MGKILKRPNLTTFFEAIIVAVGLALVLGVVFYLAPGLRVEMSKQLTGLEINSEQLNNVSPGTKLPLPTDTPSTSVASNGLINIAEYAWNGNSAMIVANGGPRTTKGSLMEASGVNLQIIRQDMVDGLRDMQIKFVEEYNKGVDYPQSEGKDGEVLSAMGVSIMGDGVPFYITTLQNSLDAKFGKGKYHAQAIAAYGLSYGEDKLIGPRIWKDNPQSMRGSVISSVVGDGDWVVACNYAFANGIPVNPDPATYDADAVNFIESEDYDYINSVKELIKSQKTGWKVELKEVKDGKLTGKTVQHLVDGATTWTPGDKMAFDALSGFTDVVSTKEFVNQMATTLVVIKEWALKHEKEVVNILKQTYIAANQMKQYDEWAVRASEAVAKTYNFETPKYWYDMFKGQKGTKDGLSYNIGGTRVFNYADAMQYYGITDGKNRYKAVYDQVSSYLTDLNPCNFNASAVDGVVPYEDAVNLYFLKSVNISDTGTAAKISYTETKTKVLANGQWHITFGSGSSAIAGSTKDLETIFNLLVQAEQAKLQVVGHTDNSGNSNNNLTLSKGRANSVVEYLVGRGISKDRFQLVDGKGDNSPIGDNSTSDGKAKNRRVEIVLLD